MGMRHMDCVLSAEVVNNSSLTQQIKKTFWD